MSLLKRTFGAHEKGQSEAAGDAMTVGSRIGSAQRIRVGLTGLAAIFLLVLIAAAGVRPSQSMAAQESAGEPLAVLGVAPGAGPATADRKSAAPAPIVANTAASPVDAPAMMTSEAAAPAPRPTGG